MQNKLIMLIAFFFSFSAYAENTFLLAQNNVAIPAVGAGATKKVQPKTIKPKGENLLDFEAEVIEGEKKRPELFLDIKAGDGNIGSGLYLRPHFDDFFVVDKKRHPRFIRAK